MNFVAKLLIYHLPKSRRLRLNVIENVALSSPHCRSALSSQLANYGAASSNEDMTLRH
jgi:hypothetical protein